MQTLVYHTIPYRPRTIDTVKENARVATTDITACSIVFTCSSNRKHINLNICVASVTPYDTGLMGHPVYVICGNVRPLSFRRFWVGFSVEFPALLPCFQRTRGTGRVHDLLNGNRYESIEKNTR